MTKDVTIPDTEETWDSGELGRDEKFAAVDTEDIGAMVNEALGLHPISIRLEKSLIEDFKFIASLHGIGYQPLMRQALKRFADCEKKRLLREVVAENAARRALKSKNKASGDTSFPKAKKVA